MQLADFGDLLSDQSGIVARRQLVEGGATPSDLRRWLRRRDLTQVHPGVYVSHTGPLSWTSRAWAAVLLHWPAALADQSVVDASGDLIHVAVARGRTPVSRPGVRLHRLDDLDARVHWHLGPPRMRLEDAVLRVAASQPDKAGALVVITDVCRRRRTTPQRLSVVLDQRTCLRHRAWLRVVLAEAAEGVQSILESTFLRRVERAHGLPRGVLQRRADLPGTGVVYRDVLYEDYGVCVELDGRIGHERSRERWDDMDRDLASAVGGLLTLRLGWRQAELTPCATALRLAEVLRARGWSGSPRPCAGGCPVGAPGW